MTTQFERTKARIEAERAEREAARKPKPWCRREVCRDIELGEPSHRQGECPDRR